MVEVAPNQIELVNTCFQNNANVVDIDLQKIAFKDNLMIRSFQNCSSLTTISNINNNVNNMSRAFINCYSLTDVPTIPNNVTDMTYTFSNCTSLVNAPSIPNSVITMYSTFGWCSNLVNAPTIPNSVTDLGCAFQHCVNLVNVPSIPYSVTNMYATFVRCSSLTSIPEIPTSVMSMYRTFANCTSITGNVIIFSEQITNAVECFANTSLRKNVYVPYNYTNGEATATYNAFINAGYTEDGSKDGVYLGDEVAYMRIALEKHLK